MARYKRFLADVDLEDGRRVTAHCANTGAMEGLTQPGFRVWLSPAENSARKLPYTWEAVEVDGRLVGVNTSLPNRLVGALLRARCLGWVPGADDWETFEAERSFGDRRRVDFWLRHPRGETYVEVKNCHLVGVDGMAYFPDCVSERASHHLEALASVAGPRVQSHVLFVVQAPGILGLRPSDRHDRVFAATARRVAQQGVTFSAVVVEQTPEHISVVGRAPVDLKPYTYPLP